MPATDPQGPAHAPGSLDVFRQNGELTSERHHPCGCVTFFNTARWASTIVRACPDHEEARRAQRA